MEDFGRQTAGSSDRKEINEIEKSLKVSSHLDTVYEALMTGQKAVAQVPNYKHPTKGEIYNMAIGSESQGMGMDFEGVYNNVSKSMGEHQTKIAMSSAFETDAGTTSFRTSDQSPPQQQQQQQQQQHTGPTVSASVNQYRAIQKFPVLVEFLGRPEGEKIARKIASEMNVIIAATISENSKEICEAEAVECIVDNQNLRQYFQGDDWVCRVTASGPFRGDEAFFYSREKDAAGILRKRKTADGIKFTDVSTDFNVIYEVTKREVTAVLDDTENIPEIAEDIMVEDFVEETTSTETETEND